MKAAKFATNFLAYSQTFIYDELRHHERYEVDVFCHARHNEDRFPWPRVHSLVPQTDGARALEAKLYKTAAYSPTFDRVIRQGSFNVLHAHFGPGSVYALPYHLRHNIPLVVTVHGYDVPLLLNRRRFQPKFWRYWAASKILLPRVNRWLAASTELHDLLLELGAPKDRVKIWRLGVEIPEAPPPATAPMRRILMVGRFVEKKGFAYGIEAFASVARDHQDICLAIAGGGDLRPQYDEIIARHGIADRVEFLGVLGHADVLQQMTSAYALVAPSVVARNGDRESGLIVVKEAAARGVPAVGTLHGGIPEIIDHDQTGFLVPERDPQAIARSLRALVESRELRDKMGAAARRKMEAEYDVRKRVAVLENHYDEVIAGAGR